MNENYETVEMDNVDYNPYYQIYYNRLNEAIESYTSELIRKDANSFSIGKINLRFVVERYLFFILCSDMELYYFFIKNVASRENIDRKKFTGFQSLILPYLLRMPTPIGASKPFYRQRFLRSIYKYFGSSEVLMEDIKHKNPKVIFHIIHSKFIKFMLPLVLNFSNDYAFLVIDDDEVYDELGKSHLPRIHIRTDKKSWNMTRDQVEIAYLNFKPDTFDFLFIRYNAIRRALAELRPLCIVIPEGNSYLNELVNQCSKSLGINTVCLQQGWSPVIHVGFRNMTYTSMCVWGEGFANILQPYNPQQKFVITGNYHVVFKGQGDLKNRKAIVFLLQNTAQWITDRIWHSTLDLIKWTAINFPEMEVRIREHPGKELDQSEINPLLIYDNIKLMPPNNYKLDEVLDNCRVAIAMTSTTLLEALVSGAVPLILDVNGFGEYNPNIVKFNAAVEVDSFDKARAELLKLINDDLYCKSFSEGIKKIREKYFSYDRSSAGDIITNEISSLCKSIDKNAFIQMVDTKESCDLSKIANVNNRIDLSKNNPNWNRPLLFLVNQISSHGHLNMYARIYSEILINLGYRVVLIAQHEDGVSEYIQERSSLHKNFKFFSRKQLRSIIINNAINNGEKSSSEDNFEILYENIFLRIRRIWKNEGLFGIMLRIYYLLDKKKSRLILVARSLFYSSIVRRLLLYFRKSGVSFGEISEELQIAKEKLNEEPELVIFLYLDMFSDDRQSCFQLSKNLNSSWAGILFHPNCYNYQEISKKENYFSAKGAVGAAFLNPVPVKIYKNLFPHMAFSCLPDVTMADIPDQETNLVRQLIRSAKGRKIILLTGSISPHKGVIDFILLIKQADKHKYFFAIIGEIFFESFGKDTRIVREFCEKPPENCLIHADYLKDERELNAIIKASDVIYAVYRNFRNSSNTLTKAAIFEKPVIVSNDFLMGNNVSRYHLGACVKYGDLDAILLALTELVCNPVQKSGFVNYRDLHSVEALKNSLEIIVKNWLSISASRKNI